MSYRDDLKAAKAKAQMNRLRRDEAWRNTWRPKPKAIDPDDSGELETWPWELVVARAERDLEMVERWRQELPADHLNQVHFTAIEQAAREITG